MEYDRHKTNYSDFGFKTVKTKLKTGLVRGLFSRVADHYDVMNDVMSFGLHRSWKKALVQALDIRPNMDILDVAGGTGDISIGIAKTMGYLHPKITVCDLTYDMLAQGRKKAINQGLIDVMWHNGNAEQLPYPDASFDRVTIAFGLRNVTNKELAISEIARVLKPGGMFFCLEFSPPEGPLKPLYDLYSFNIIPMIGKILAKDREAYQYLVESIRQFPKPGTLNNTILAHGFSKSSYQKWTSGIVYLHQSIR